MRWSVLVVVLGVGGVAFGGEAMTLPFRVSKETTGIVGPLREDGRPDYLRVLNREGSEGVTAENNGFVKWLEVVGTGEKVMPAEVRDEILRMCGGKRADGVQFLYFNEYLKEKGMSDEMIEKHRDDLWSARQRGWKRGEFPEVAGYLERIDKQLDGAAEAIARPKWWMPLGGESAGAMKFPLLGTVRPLGEAYLVRGMKRLGEGDFKGFVTDVGTARRFGRHWENDQLMLEQLLGAAILSRACETEAIVVGSGKLTKEQCDALKKMNDDLMPERARWASADQLERWGALDMAMLVALGKGNAIEGYAKHGWDKINRSQVNWDFVLKRINELWDEPVGMMRMEDFAKERAATDIRRKRAEDFFESSYERSLAKGEGEPSEAYWERVTDSLAYGNIFPLGRADELRRIGEMEERMLDVVVAAGRYKAETGDWPVELGKLVPVYLKEVPRDMYSKEGGTVRFAVSEAGIRVYSVWENGRDDGGVVDMELKKDDVGVGVGP